jgi:hypothetical protein
MLLGDVLLCPPVVTAPKEKTPRWVCCLRQTTEVEHGEAKSGPSANLGAGSHIPTIDNANLTAICDHAKLASMRTFVAGREDHGRQRSNS